MANAQISSFALRSSLVVGAALYCLPAAALDTNESASSMGMGGAVRADPDEISVLQSSPATMALEDSYALAATGIIGGPSVLGLRLEGMDSRTGPVSLGLAYLRQDSEPRTADDDLPGWREPGTKVVREDRRESAIVVGGAYGWFDNHMAAGVTVVRYSDWGEWSGEDTSWNVGASLAGKPAEIVTVSLTGSNLSNTGHDVAPTTLAAAGRIEAEDMAAAEVDLVTDFTSRPDEVTLSYIIGGELVIREVAPFRLGFHHDRNERTDFLALGLGLDAEAVRLDYGFRSDLGDFGLWGERTWHSLQLRIAM